MLQVDCYVPWQSLSTGASIWKTPVFVYKTPEFPNVTRWSLCPLTVMVHRCQNLKNTNVRIQNSSILKTPAFPDVTSRLLCPLTVTVDRCQHLKNASVRIQNTSISRCYNSTSMSLDSHGWQVPAFKKYQCSYTKHQHFPMFQVDRYVFWQSRSTGASI